MAVRDRFHYRYFGPQGLIEAVGLCLHQHYTGSALALICAAIESFSFVGLPEGFDEVEDRHFISWINTYMDPNRLGISARELWMIRCRLIDRNAAGHEVTESGASRQVLFSWGQYAVSDGLQLRPGTRWHRIMMIRADEIYKSLYRGAVRFEEEFVLLPENEHMAGKRLNQVFKTE